MHSGAWLGEVSNGSNGSDPAQKQNDRLYMTGQALECSSSFDLALCFFITLVRMDDFPVPGDLGRWRAGGVVDLLGRKDFQVQSCGLHEQAGQEDEGTCAEQVKLRGFRIELGEIEA